MHFTRALRGSVQATPGSAGHTADLGTSSVRLQAKCRKTLSSINNRGRCSTATQKSEEFMQATTESIDPTADFEQRLWGGLAMCRERAFPAKTIEESVRHEGERESSLDNLLPY